MTPSFFDTVYRNWNWLGIVFMALGLAGIVASIRGIVLTIRNARLFSVPLIPTQPIDFPEAGPVVLCMEGPRFSRRFSGLAYALTGSAGDPVPGHRSLFRARTTGISTARMELMGFELPRAGRYILAVGGLGAPRAEDSRHAIVFVRPHLAQTVAYILGIILAAWVFIPSLVFFILRLSGLDL
jgi:hypothetical protein